MAWWTTQNVVITALVALGAAAACRFFRIGPVGRHALWVVVLVKLLLPPVGVWPWSLPGGVDRSPASESRIMLPQVSRVPIAALPTAIAAPQPLPAEPLTQRYLLPMTAGVATPAAERAPSAPASDPSAPTAPAGLFGTVDQTRAAVIAASQALARAPWPAIWLIGAVVFALLQAVRAARLGLSVRRGTPPPSSFAARVDSLARSLHMRPVRTHIVTGITTPMIWAAGKPALLWPAGLDVHGRAADALIVHELAHVKRGDHFVGWLELAAGCLWWWNPLFWIVRRQIRDNAELACDGWVVQSLPGSRRAYAEALVALCERLSRPRLPLPAVGVSAGNRSFLERRLVMIMQARVPLRLPRTGALCAAILTVLTLPAWAQRTTPPAQVPVAPQPATTVPAPAAAPAPVARPVTPATAPVATTPRLPAAAAAPVAQTAQPMPPDAQRLLDQYVKQQNEIRREAEARITRERDTLIKELQVLQDRHTRAGELDEAVAIRNRIRQLQRGDGGWVTGAYDWSGRLEHGGVAWTPTYSSNRLEHVYISDRAIPIDSSNWGPVYLAHGRDSTLGRITGRVGETFTIPIIGSRDGSVWGDGVYTDDSSISAAAVHAGAVEAGQFGLIKLTMVAGRDSYEGSSKNGVTSQPFASWTGSYSVARASTTDVVRVPDEHAWLVRLNEFRGRNVSFTLEIVGSASGQVWGTGTYTDDSSIGAAAVHAGLLKPGERGLVRIILLPGQDKYSGSLQNGIESSDYAAWQGSFRLERPR